MVVFRDMKQSLSLKWSKNYEKALCRILYQIFFYMGHIGKKAEDYIGNGKREGYLYSEKARETCVRV